MRFGLISDAHLSSRTGIEDISAMLPATGSIDAMVLLGDICAHDQVERICKHVHATLKCPVLFIPGNHEYYCIKGSPLSMNEIECAWRQSLATEPGIHLLIDQGVELMGVCFFGSTWWSNLGSDSDRIRFDLDKDNFNDFDYIYRQAGRLLTPDDMIELNNAAIVTYQHWYRFNEGKKRVLLAHFPMLYALVHENRNPSVYFISADDEMIMDHAPDLVCFGHTHWNIESEVHGIPCRSNMHGYSKEKGAIGFRPGLSIEIDPF